jgi:DNA-binding winged helix-turn-helix (wHTH) protein
MGRKTSGNHQELLRSLRPIVKYSFDPFVVDDESRLLLRDGTPVHLSAKAFDLLVTLLCERPRALPKEELHTRLWPQTFVSDTSLAMLVAEVRAALGDRAYAPRWIRTVHRHGYAFHGPVHAPATTAEGPKAVAPPPSGGWLVTPSREFPLVQGENVVGREPGATVRLDAPSISRRHARIVVEAGRVTLEDLGSKNGTYVRGAQISGATAIEDRDQVRFGSVSVTFRSFAADPTITEGDPPCR